MTPVTSSPRGENDNNAKRPTMTSLKTDRLILRPLELSDAPRIASLCADWDVARMTGSMPFPHPAISVEGFLLIEQARRSSGRDRLFAIEAPGEGLIGVIGAHLRGRDYSGRFVMLGYWLGRSYWGRGYATEAVRAVADFAAELGYGPVRADHFADNPASGRVLEKAGFRYTGETEQHFSLARRQNTASRLMQRYAEVRERAA
jgi:RimJ/RimL family protein N-acetyltransferase